MSILATFSIALCLLPGLVAGGTNEVGKKFLEENKKRPGVVTLSSGLQYKVLREGDGIEHPKDSTACECHFAGTTPSLTPNAIDLEEQDWKEFDSSYKRGSPMTVSPKQGIKGWMEAMQLMVAGDKWEMYIPSELGYGDEGKALQKAKIEGGDVLIFRVEILEIKGGATRRADRCDVKTLEGCLDEQLEYVEKQQGNTEGARRAELQRLEGLLAGDIKDEKREWMVSRVKMLKQMVTKDEL